MAKAKNLSGLINEQLGVDTRPVISNPQIGTTVQKVLSNNDRRCSLTFINLSTNDIYIMIDNQVSATRCIRLGSGGGSASLNWQYDLHILLWEWHALASGANSELLIIEAVAL